MRRFARIAKTVAAVAATGALDAMAHSGDMGTTEGIARTAAIGALGGVLYWMRSPKDKPETPPRQSPPQD